MNNRLKFYLVLIGFQVIVFFLIDWYPDYFWPILITSDLILALGVNYYNYPISYRQKCWTDKNFHVQVFITFGMLTLIGVIFYYL